MKITIETMGNKTLYERLGEETLQKMVPYVDKIFATVGCKTEKIIVADNLHNRALTLKFLSVKEVDGLFEVTLNIHIIFSEMGSGYLPPDKRILNMSSFALPKFDNKIQQLVYMATKKIGKTEGFATHYTDVSSQDTYDSQMQKMVDAHNNHFERDIEIYRKAVKVLMHEGDPTFLAALPHVRELFVFN